MNGPLTNDTAPDVEKQLVERWRAMSASEKLRLAVQMSVTVRELALAGVQQRFPTASPREQFLRLARITLGDSLALDVYPELAALSDE